MLLILDLDDTIFPTASIPEQVVGSALSPVIDYCHKMKGKAFAQKVKQALWQRPFDQVMAQYDIPQSIQEQTIQHIHQLEFDLNISPFADYRFLQQLPLPKILVTTGFRSLQWSKIRALGIQDDFEEIHIDDPSEPDRIFKQGIFEGILTERLLSPSDCWVIGDNPDSEIKAALALGMHTIQRIHASKALSEEAASRIHDFSELQRILGPLF